MAIKINKAEVGLKTDLYETGVVMPVRDANDEPKFFGGDPNKPVSVLVRSIRSAAAKALALKLQKRNTAMNRGRRNADVQIPNEEYIAHQASVLALELINFDADTPSQRGTEVELYAVFSAVEMEDVANQIFEFGKDDRNFGGKTSGNDPAGAVATQESPTSES